MDGTHRRLPAPGRARRDSRWPTARRAWSRPVRWTARAQFTAEARPRVPAHRRRPRSDRARRLVAQDRAAAGRTRVLLHGRAGPGLGHQDQPRRASRARAVHRSSSTSSRRSMPATTRRPRRPASTWAIRAGTALRCDAGSTITGRRATSATWTRPMARRPRPGPSGSTFLRGLPPGARSVRVPRIAPTDMTSSRGSNRRRCTDTTPRVEVAARSMPRDAGRPGCCAARPLITMRGDEVIADADLVVHDDRIAAHRAARARWRFQRAPRVVDARGKFVVPGLDRRARRTSAASVAACCSSTTGACARRSPTASRRCSTRRRCRSTCSRTRT